MKNRLFAVVLVSVCVSLITVFFSYLIDLAFSFFLSHQLFAFALPFVGVLTFLLYRILKVPFSFGTQDAINNVHRDTPISLLLIPAAFLGTLGSIIAGGSVGKEGTALQMASAISSKIERVFHLDTFDREIVSICAISAAFTSLLHAPISGFFFAIEISRFASRKLFSYLALVISSVIAWVFSYIFKMHEIHLFIDSASFNLHVAILFLVIVVLAKLCGHIFSFLLSSFRNFFGASQIRQICALVIVGILGAIFIVYFGGSVYSGTGSDDIEKASAHFVEGPIFAVKLFITALFMGAGFKGGEIMPSLSIGATLGGYIFFLAYSQGFVPAGYNSLFIAIGLIAFFTACTNAPLASAFLAIELCGGAGIYFLYFFVASVIAYGRGKSKGFYSNTRFYAEIFSNLKNK